MLRNVGAVLLVVSLGSCGTSDEGGSPAVPLPAKTTMLAANTAGEAPSHDGKLTLHVVVGTFDTDVQIKITEGVASPAPAVTIGKVYRVEVTDQQRYKLPLGTQAQVEFTVESVSDALMVPAEAVMTFQDERGIWIKTAAAPGSLDKYGKKFIPCRFGITDGAHTHLISPIIDEDEVNEGVEILTKLPREREENK